MHSLWTETVALPSFESLNKNVKTDVLIIGGGITGILTAYYLQQAGINYMLVEADTICSGITKNTTAKITSQHGLIYHKIAKKYGMDAAGLYLEANETALWEYRKLSEEVLCDFAEETNFVYSLTRPDKIEKELDTLRKLRFPASFAEHLPLPFFTAGAVAFPNQAKFHPLKLLAELAKSLRIYEHTKVQELVGNLVITNAGNILADKIIVTTHFPFLNKHGNYFLKMYQHRSYVLALTHADKPQGMYVDEADNGLSFRTHQNLLLLGGGGHRTGKQGGNWMELRKFASIQYPDAREILHWATQDCMTLDGIPYIGQYSRHTPNLYVATGYNKWGMTSAMVAALLLRDLITEKQSDYAKVFSPSRSILQPQLLLNGMEATVNLLTPTRKRCPHLGCALKWNKQEHTWDCPCHGSRFTEKGEVIDNPATDDLKK
ncbi:MAG: FAD-dependent oxidoreductase [Lachnospiraceae bacterium]|nr:FAD-dependent oxidoreductase [Lachnospiraceae bacterium]